MPVPALTGKGVAVSAGKGTLAAPLFYGIADWGPLVIATDVDEAILAVFQEWMPTYLKQVASERALGYELATVNTYANTLDSDEFMDHQLPAIIVTTADTAKTLGGANFTYQATWNVVVSVIVRGRRPPESRKTAALYEGAIRRCFLNKCRQNSGPLSDPDWKGTRVAPVKDTTGAGRYLAAGIGTYNVSTDAAAQGFGGPDVPNADKYVPLATVTEVDISVQAESEG